MLILGLLLLACTAAFVGLVIADNLGGGPDYSVTVFGHHIATMDGLAIFCAGLALALVFALGVVLAMTGMKMRRRTGRKLHAARRQAAEAARERDELAERLDRVHAEHEAAERDTPAMGPADGDVDVEAAGQGPVSAPAETAAGTPAGEPEHPAHRRQRHLFGH
ncbi:hypothetical protein [Actinacidiphila rubida]|uniref:Lipopolysaccharide assembly protein A domain-containing protein n=1 Tax=Actinacidiphila rubida TaxID=310780 RepID=A0A1H8SPK8_9ACTN|nr:hypothetical protein [Actinacidiphila rubida]SEO80466.1 hypothetical protein SAMN05216267_104438 [Actinacidiphila rubida]